MGVLINNSQNKHRIRQSDIRKTAQAILNALDCPDGELSILIVDDNEIAKLNKQYLHREGSTNVIAFPMRDENSQGVSHNLLGDVVISVETAEREGNDSGVGMSKRFTELMLHGILHLFGYDHENNEQEARRMDRKARELLKGIDM